MFLSAFPPELCAKMTFFQFSQGVSDTQAFPLLGCHPVWQNALAIPVQTVEFMPLYLCKFRASFNSNQLAQHALAAAQHALIEAGLLPQNVQELCTATIVNAVCLVNHLGSLLVAMNEALELLAAVYPDWLQQTMRPHWIDRYPWQQPAGLPVCQAEQAALASTLAEDVLYLLNKFEQEVGQKRPFPGTISLLKKVFWAQFTTSSHGFYWTPQPCAYCTLPLPA